MNRHNLTRTIFGAALLFAFAACTQDEPTDGNGTSLPEGKYPLEIGSISLAAEVDEQPWRAGAPQTRVSENGDGNSSHWETGDVIYAKTDGAQEAGSFRIENAQGSLTVQKTTYWTKTTENVTAWYPAEGTVELADQSNKLAYVLQAVAENASYNQPIELGFTHQLAKVRVTLQGDQAEKVTDVKIKSYITCTNAQGAVSTDGATEGWITMMKVTRGTKTVWEANVVPDHAITAFQVNGVESTLDNGGITPLAAKVNTIELIVGNTLQPVDGKFTINQGDDVLIKDYDGTAPIVVNGDATITIRNVKLETTGDVMTINNGVNVTLNIEGTDNELTSTTGAGIKIMGTTSASQCGNITINGKGTSNSKLKITAKDGAAVGFRMVGDGNSIYCGDININDITLEATGGSGSPAIGISKLKDDRQDVQKQYGNISISGSEITAFSSGNAACIGTPDHNTSSPFSLGVISIENSTVTATADGSQAACIGFGYTYNHTFKNVIQKIVFNQAILYLNTDAANKVGFGEGNDHRQLTEGIWNNGNKVGDTGWNP